MRVIQITPVFSSGEWGCTQCEEGAAGLTADTAREEAHAHLTQTGHVILAQYAVTETVAYGELNLPAEDVIPGELPVVR